VLAENYAFTIFTVKNVAIPGTVLFKVWFMTQRWIAKASPVIVVVVIAQQFISCRQLSRLSKFATTAGLSHRFCTVELHRMILTVEQLFYGVWCHLICRW